MDLYVADIKAEEGLTGSKSGLHIAAIHDTLEIARVLVQKGCRMDITNAEVMPNFK